MESSTSWNKHSESEGASGAAIRLHYDVGNSFYGLWLDKSMTYSCALWERAGDLEEAQERKLDLHLEWAKVRPGDHVLDVGCGWGSLLKRFVSMSTRNTAVGLTLSEEQARYARSSLPRSSVDVRVESWRDHSPSRLYDAIVSIGALEHFVKPESSEEARVRTYAHFFDKCREWSAPGSYLSLQTIAYRDGTFRHGVISAIFPESDLPRIDQIELGAADRYEIVQLRRDPEDYARTCHEWWRRLKACEEAAVRVVGRSRVDHFLSFLQASERGFRSGVFDLLRIQFRRLD